MIFNVAVPAPGSERPFREAKVRFHRVYYPSDVPYTAYVFINQRNVSKGAPREDNEHYAGRFGMMARKHVPGNEEKGLLPWARASFQPPESDPDLPPTIDVDIKPQIAATGPGAVIAVTVALFDRQGQRLPDELFRCDGVSVEFEY
jgi:hypothetical protein